jgi:hypothetical protein
MSETPLHQQVECRWTLGGLFVEVYCKSVLVEPPGARPYEAVYHIGHNAEHDRYVLRLLDTPGVALTEKALARRKPPDFALRSGVRWLQPDVLALASFALIRQNSVA